MRIHKVVIPAAGSGRRLYPTTKAQPKAMLPVGRKPAIQWVAEEVVANGLQQILIITGQQKRAIEDHFDTVLDAQAPAKSGHLFPDILNSRDVSFFFVRQSYPRGLGDAIAHAQPFVGDEPFAVALADAIIIEASRPASLLRRMMGLFVDKRPAAVVAVREVPDDLVSSYGIVEASNGGSEAFTISHLVEKPHLSAAPSNLAVTARYILSPELFRYLANTPPDESGEIQLSDALRLMLEDGHDIWAMRLTPGEIRYDVGNFYEYAKSFIALAVNDPEQGAAISEYLRELVMGDEQR